MHPAEHGRRYPGRLEHRGDAGDHRRGCERGVGDGHHGAAAEAVDDAGKLADRADAEVGVRRGGDHDLGSGGA